MIVKGFLSRSRWLRHLANKLAPGSFWDGTGIVVTKSHQPGYQIDNTGNSWFPKPRVDPTWLLTVRDHAGRDHHIEVDEPTWKHSRPGDRFPSSGGRRRPT